MTQYKSPLRRTFDTARRNRYLIVAIVVLVVGFIAIALGCIVISRAILGTGEPGGIWSVIDAETPAVIVVPEPASLWLLLPASLVIAILRR